jgi:serine/threonine-protein kinase
VSKKRPPKDPDRDTLVDRRTQMGVGTSKEMPAVDLVGQVVGGYLVEEQLGSGAMGAVFRGSHIDTNRVVALKALHPHLMSEKSVVERFRREAKLAARLSHPYIGSVIELARADDDRQVIVLEYVEGEPLSSIMTMPLPPERVTLLVRQLLLGLEYAHGAGLIHRDLKPDNVLVEWRNGRDHARIVDFGIAILRDGAEGESLERLTATGQMIGTPLYMSPEQARGEPIDERADLFSLGIIVYEMLAGVLPFEGRPLDILSASLTRDAPPIEKRVPGLIVEPLLELYCRKLMSRDLARRFASARHALEVLDLIAHGDERGARLGLGLMDVERALAVISLPPPPKR